MKLSSAEPKPFPPDDSGLPAGDPVAGATTAGREGGAFAARRARFAGGAAVRRVVPILRLDDVFAVLPPLRAVFIALRADLAALRPPFLALAALAAPPARAFIVFVFFAARLRPFAVLLPRAFFDFAALAMNSSALAIGHIGQATPSPDAVVSTP